MSVTGPTPYVEFAGPGSAPSTGPPTAPLTWGQRAIWEAIVRTAPDDHYFNFGRVLKVPGSRTVAEVCAALAALLARHGAFRTRMSDPLRTTLAEPYQRLAEKGRLPVVVTTEDPDRVLDELAARPFDYFGEWPVRVALVLDGDRVAHVVLVFCHLAADGLGAEVALRDLRILLLRGPNVRRPAAPQPLDLARRQAGAEGRRAAQTAAAHWEREYRRIPPTMFAAFSTSSAPSGSPAGPPIWRALLRSPALELAVRSIAAEHAASTSTVLLTAVAELVGRFTGHETCAVLPISANRFRRDTTDIVATMSQEGLFTLDRREATFAGLLRAAGPAALRAYRSAYHDPADRNRITASVSAERGEPIHPYCCFNDMRFADPGPARCDPAEITAALAQTSVTWPMSQDKLNCRFCVHLTAEGVSLTADTRCLSRPGMERYLLELEALLVETALR
ncbi:condensation domain-containing protein [Microbispora hainanensis]|uniref:Non-ribosomal peptide synthetase condensation domain protein n=1 Tax=Microbispora hainanensis TaxID=568844 RepID=A0A544YMF9_9ACTN|nr:condensation domain-containing protein [Microbispora hainanensis]TQS17961.1 non-ribosomal peptide synthetase condensation domain protein [Microbispora hainanensis]